MSARIDNDILSPYIGEIVCGSTHYGCTTPHFYRIEKLSGGKTVILKRLHVIYDSSWGPNSPLYGCIPSESLGKDPEKYGDKPWYDVGRDWESNEPPEKAHIYEWGNEYGNHPEKYYITSNRLPIMWLWNGEPQYGNCD